MKRAGSMQTDKAIRQIRAKVEHAERQLDARAFARLLTDDVAMLPLDNRIDGASAVERFHRELYERFEELEVRFEIEQIHVFGDLGVETDRYTARSKTRDGREARRGWPVHLHLRAPAPGCVEDTPNVLELIRCPEFVPWL